MDALDYALTDAEFDRVRARVHALAGISLSDAKRTMVLSRLSKVVKAQGLEQFSDYLDFLETADDAAQQQFVNALTTNLTRFWREEHHFAHLTAQVGELIRHRPRFAADGRPRLRIWSAGCSTGQEPYTIALSLLAAFPELKRWDFRILATDIDTAVLERAATGVYPSTELHGLPPERAALLDVEPDGSIRIPPAARAVVSFKPLNLLAPWPMRGLFDAIFCRNVTIYFDRATQAGIFSRFAGILAPEGFLYIGHSENLTGGDQFRLVGKTIYQARKVRAKDAA